MTGELVSGAFADPAHVHYVPDWQQAAEYTARVARPGDYVITLGCGNVYQIIPQVLEALSRTEAPASERASAFAPAAAAGVRPAAEGRASHGGHDSASGCRRRRRPGHAPRAAGRRAGRRRAGG